jgi:hypothetical protein
LPHKKTPEETRTVFLIVVSFDFIFKFYFIHLIRG